MSKSNMSLDKVKLLDGILKNLKRYILSNMETGLYMLYERNNIIYLKHEKVIFAVDPGYLSIKVEGIKISKREKEAITDLIVDTVNNIMYKIPFPIKDISFYVNSGTINYHEGIISDSKEEPGSKSIMLW